MSILLSVCDIMATPPLNKSRPLQDTHAVTDQSISLLEDTSKSATHSRKIRMQELDETIKPRCFSQGGRSAKPRERFEILRGVWSSVYES